jgi:ParB family transcriptional regulator, chromosome partitioning protein
MQPKRALGKGLDALIPKKSELVPIANTENEVAIGQILPNRHQPRQEMDTLELRELSESLKANGFIQPLLVRKAGDNYEVVAGGRRFEAAKLAGFTHVPVVVRELSDKDSLVLAIVENLQRKDLNAIEEAQAFKRLMDDFSFSLDDLARFISKDKTTVANTLRLLKLPLEVRRGLQKGLISRSQARTILGLPTDIEQIKLFHELLSSPITVREIEVRTRVAKGAVGRKKSDPFVEELEQKLQNKFGTKVRIFNNKKNRGKIVIEYYNLDDMERIVRRIG